MITTIKHSTNDRITLRRFSELSSEREDSVAGILYYQGEDWGAVFSVAGHVMAPSSNKLWRRDVIILSSDALLDYYKVQLAKNTEIKITV